MAQAGLERCEQKEGFEMDLALTALTPASGTSVVPRQRSISPERVRNALADMDHVMAAFEVGDPEPSMAPTPARTLAHEPSWAPSMSMR
jgi:hypothetical protein